VVFDVCVCVLSVWWCVQGFEKQCSRAKFELSQLNTFIVIIWEIANICIFVSFLCIFVSFLCLFCVFFGIFS